MDGSNLRGLRFVGYVRVSTEEQTRGNSPQIQFERILDWAKANGLRLATNHDGASRDGVFQDEFSGFAYERPAMDAIRNLARRGLIDVVVVNTIDRFARDEIVSLVMARFFSNHGIRLFSVSEGEFTPGAINPYIAAMQRTLAQSDIQRHKDRMRIHRREYVNRGAMPAQGMARLGYKKVGNRGDVKYEIVEEEAEVVRLIFQIYCEEGLSDTGVSNRLNEMNIPTYATLRGYNIGVNRIWNRNVVSFILTSPAYAGYWTTYRYFDDNIDMTAPRRANLGAEVIVIEVPPIITQEEWDEAQRLRSEHRRANRKHPEREKRKPRLLASLIRCRQCGHFVEVGCTVTHSKRYYYYRCKERDCSNHSNADRVEARVWGFIQELLSDPQTLTIHYEQFSKDLESHFEDAREHIEIITRMIEEYAQEHDRMIKLYQKGHIDDDYLEVNLNMINKAVEGLQPELDRWKKIKADLNIADIQISFLEQLRKDIAQLPEDEDAAMPLKRQVLKKLGVIVGMQRDPEGPRYGMEPILYVTIQQQEWRLPATETKSSQYTQLTFS